MSGIFQSVGRYISGGSGGISRRRGMLPEGQPLGAGSISHLYFIALRNGGIDYHLSQLVFDILLDGAL